VQVALGEPMYDMTWYPWMNQYQPETCVFAVSQAHHPVHLFDANTGQVRASYIIQNPQEQIMGAYSVLFSPDGRHLYTGLESWFNMYDVQRPGKDPVVQFRTQKTKKDKRGQKGIFSCLQISSPYQALAIASYGRTIGIYDQRTYELHHLIRGLSAATRVVFDPSGQYMISSHREDGCVHCFDLRTFKIVWSLHRRFATNMRTSVQVTEDGAHVIIAGCGEHGKEVWQTDLLTGKATQMLISHEDVISCCQSRGEWAVSISGQRQFPLPILDDDFSTTPNQEGQEHAIRLWQLNGSYEYIPLAP
jgi:WD40 repeat protein